MAGERHNKSCIDSSHGLFDENECEKSLLNVCDDYLNNIV